MRKTLLALSALALPLAACEKEEATPPDADPIAQDVEMPAPETVPPEEPAPSDEETASDEETTTEKKASE